MKRHQIEIKEMETYSFTHLMAAAHGKGENKSLSAVVCNGKVSYEIFNNKELVYETESIPMAIEQYNNIYPHNT